MIKYILACLVFFNSFAYADTDKELKNLDLKQFVTAHDIRLKFVLEGKKAPYSGFIIPPSDFVLFKTEFEFMENEINIINNNMIELCKLEISGLVMKHHDSIQQMVDDNIKLTDLLKTKEQLYIVSLKEEKIRTRNYTLVGVLTGAVIAGTTVLLLK